VIEVNKYAEERSFNALLFKKMLDAGRASVSFEYPDDRWVTVDYRRLFQPGSVHRDFPFLFLTGWGSGWEGIVPLAFSLFAEGHDVIVFSLPGYGSSSDPKPDAYEEGFYAFASGIIKNFLDAINVQQVHLVGHSMGAEILGIFASCNPSYSQSLTLISPSGADEFRGFWRRLNLARRFAVSGWKLRRDAVREQKNLQCENYLNPLIEICGTQKTPFSFRRLRQRWSEFNEICREKWWSIVRRVSCPTIVILGLLDSVFPAHVTLGKIDEINKFRIDPGKMIKVSCISGMHHNPTLFRPEAVARRISEFVRIRE